MKSIQLFKTVVVAFFTEFQLLAQDTFSPQINDPLRAIPDDAVAAGNPGVVLRIDSPQGSFAGGAGQCR